MVLLALLSCGEDCVELPADCTPQYPPTFDRVWEETLLPTCALSGCHATGQGGLTMGTTADEAYAALLDGYVVPGDPGCSVIVSRIEPTGEGGMPPGSVLAEEERCSVETWIADGAAR
jgi:hypothetical protein